MEILAEINYPQASCAQAFALAIDTDFRRAVCEATHASDFSVTVEARADGGADVFVERTMPANVPDFVRAFVGDTVVVVQTERWGPAATNGTRSADLTVVIKGQPAKLTGSIVLAEHAEGVRELVRGDLRVSMPFVGKKVEPLIGEQIVSAVQKEEETGLAWLKDGRVGR